MYTKISTNKKVYSRIISQKSAAFQHP